MRLASILTTTAATAASVVLVTGPALARHIDGSSGDDHLQGPPYATPSAVTWRTT